MARNVWTWLEMAGNSLKCLDVAWAVLQTALLLTNCRTQDLVHQVQPRSKYLEGSKFGECFFFVRTLRLGMTNQQIKYDKEAASRQLTVDSRQ